MGMGRKVEGRIRTGGEEAASGHKNNADTGNRRLAEGSRYRTWAEMITFSHI